MAIARLINLHPHLAAVPLDGESTLDSPLPPAPPIDWSKAGNLFPINGEKKHTPMDPDGDIEAVAADQDGNSDDEEDRARSRAGNEANWEDWTLCLGAEIMAEIRGVIRQRLGYTCSAVSPTKQKPNSRQGIAHNKVLSKLCSAWKKPNNQVRAQPSQGLTLDRPTPSCSRCFPSSNGLYRCQSSRPAMSLTFRFASWGASWGEQSPQSTRQLPSVTCCELILGQTF